jgi:hypothetical protein
MADGNPIIIGQDNFASSVLNTTFLRRNVAGGGNVFQAGIRKEMAAASPATPEETASAWSAATVPALTAPAPAWTAPAPASASA